MGTRTQDLTATAKPVADRLARRVGHLKVALSAGIIALDHLDSPDREAMIGMANEVREETIDLYAERRALLELRDFVRQRMMLIGDKIHPTAKPICDKVIELADRGIAEHCLVTDDHRLARSKKDLARSRESELPQTGDGTG
jgi:hypothetical protein